MKIILILVAMHTCIHAQFALLNANMETKDTLVCVGLDPDPAKMPNEIRALDLPVEEQIFVFLKEVIDLTAEHACCYKLQKAFYDPLDGGHALLKRTIEYVRSKHMPAFVDCKIGDTDNTMDIYIDNLFDKLSASGIVINPYMGDDVFYPFMADPEKIGIVLVQTSNPSATIVQNLVLESGQFLWEEMLDLTLNRWNLHGNLIPVLASTSEETDYNLLRQLIPDETPILLAGIGAQGGNLKALNNLLNSKRAGVFINSSRGLLYPYHPNNSFWRGCILEATLELKHNINKVRYETY